MRFVREVSVQIKHGQTPQSLRDEEVVRDAQGIKRESYLGYILNKRFQQRLYDRFRHDGTLIFYGIIVITIIIFINSIIYLVWYILM